MLKLGIIAYANNSGLGTIAANFRKHLSLDSQLVIRHPIKGTYDIDISHTFGDIDATEDQLNEYLDTCKPDVVIIVETPFNFNFFKIMHDRGIKVVLIPMIDSISVEKFIPYEKYIDLVINVTEAGQKIYEEQWQGCNINGIRLPYPIDTDYFCPPENTVPEFIFAHSEGAGGAGFRKSTDLVQTAYQQLYYKYKKISISLTSQRSEQIHSQLKDPVGLTTITSHELPEAVDLYHRGKIYVCPSRREGLGLPILEAMACGLPVITTDAPPMNSWFSKDYSLLVKVQTQTDLPYGDIPMYTPNVFDLMQKMEFAYKNPKLMEQIGKNNRIIIKEKFSWNVLRDTYLAILNKQ
ncbi:MAG: glycosyltransferase family 4 protein [Chloroflexota bacterium]|nr:glycosyltransferase family 4 protein [Chloroflexota bacterium]